jgi:formylglycine-generating enzyme required for sulfatase activity
LPPDNLPSAPRDLGLVTSGQAVLGIEPGAYRVLVQADGGAFAELQRTLGLAGEVTVHPTLALPGPGADEMVLVGGGSGRLEDHDRAIPFECPPFWIDRSPVTNREFRAFLEASGRWPSDEWPAEWLDVWNGVGPVPRPVDWDDLPVVKVSWTRAREYAEWRGKRLPTIGEWWLSLGFGALARPPEETRVQLERQFALDRPRFRDRPDGSPSTLLAYLEQARPARLEEAKAFGPYRVWHPFGNVSHWLESAEFVRDSSDTWTISGYRYEALGAWHATLAAPDEGFIGKRSEKDASGDLGFRCAKTATL